VADTRSKIDAVTIVTLRSLVGMGGVESPGLEAKPDPKQQEVIDRYNRITEMLQDETAKTSSEVLITVQDREASLVQSRLAEDAEAGTPLPAGGIEAQFGEGLTGGDLWGWFRSLFDHIDKREWHPIVQIRAQY